LQRLEGYRITAIGDLFPALHERGLAQLSDAGGVPTYSEYDDLLADPNVDAVALTVRCKEQGAMAARALEAGKHVNAEVPAAHTIEDCWRIVVATERSGLVYQLAEQQRYAGFFSGWRDLVQRGRLGHVVYFEGEYISYHGTWRFFQDWDTGEFVYPEDLPKHPNAKPTWSHSMDLAHYFVHDLGPILMVLDDRVARVTGMGTRKESYAHPEIKHADIQVALMHTDKDTILRMAQGSTQMISSRRDHHHFQMIGTLGSIESGCSYDEPHRLWLADSQMHDSAIVDWRYERTDAPPEAVECGH
jgi:predicted dehydrogenase